MEEVIHGLETMSAKIRALAQEGHDRTEIATFLGVRYQHVRKVLLDAGITAGLRSKVEQEAAFPKRILVPVAIPTLGEFRQGYLAFRGKERRDAMYKTATFLVRHFWGKFAEIADGLGVLLLTWNNAHYRYGSFDFQLLEKTLADNQQLLASFRNRHIFSYAPADDPSITRFSASFWRRCGSARARKKEWQARSQ
jgi:hypothetical protein